MERITKDKFRLRGKNDDERQEEPHHGHMVKSRQKDGFKIGYALSPRDHKARQRADYKGDEDKENDAQKEGSVRHRHLGNAQKKTHDGDKCHKNNEIIRSNLHHCIGGVPLCERAPDKNHGRAGRRP